MDRTRRLVHMENASFYNISSSKPHTKPLLFHWNMKAKNKIKKNWSVYIDWIAVTLEESLTEEHTQIYPLIHPSIHLSICLFRQAAIAFPDRDVAHCDELIDRPKRAARDCGRGGRHECLSGWCGEWGLHAVNSLNVPLWHAWNTFGCASMEKKHFDENQLNQ